MTFKSKLRRQMEAEDKISDELWDEEELLGEHERFYSLSEGEQDAELALSLGKLAHTESNISWKARNRRCIQLNLWLAQRYREHIKTFGIPFLNVIHRNIQMRLLKLRIERQTGIYPGEA